MAEISLIMSVYNVERYVERAIKCILMQTLYDFELIIVNDGSKDQTRAIISKYAADRRMKIIDKKHEGIAAARNAGLKEATGTYVSFIESEHQISFDLLEKTVNHAKKVEADLLMFGYYKENISPQEKIISSQPVRLKAGDYTRTNPPDWPISASSLEMFGYLWNKIYRREILEKHHIRFNPHINYLDNLSFNANVLQVIERFSILDECLYHYKRRNHLPRTASYLPAAFEDQLHAIDSGEEFLRNWGKDPELARAASASLHIYAVKGYCSHLFSNKSDLRFLEKCSYVSDAMNQPLMRERVKQFKAKNTKEWLFKFTIQSRLAVALALISTLYPSPEKKLHEKTSS